jgi:hypothetical protein
MTRPRAEIATRMTPRLVFGLTVMVLGLLLTLDNLGVIEARNYLRFWPVVLIAMGLSRFLQPPEVCPRGPALVWIGVGALFLLNTLGVVRIRQLWPLVLLLLGGSMVWRALTAPSRPRREVVATVVTTAGLDRGEPAPAVTSDPYITTFALMGGVTRGSNSQDFRGGEAVAVMGGCEIDLRKARIQGGEAVIDTFALWGGIEIYVPEDWEVVNKGTAVMGGFEDKSRRPAEPKGRLVVTGFALMGGVEIEN